MYKNDRLTKDDNNLIRAMERCEETWIKAYPDELELANKYTYSKRHIKRMNRMLNHYDSLFYRMTYTTKRQIVAVILVGIIGFTMLLITNTEARAAIINFFMSMQKTHAELLFEKEIATNEIIDYYEPTYLPEGYVKYDVEQDLYANIIEYRHDENGHIIIFWQQVIGNSPIAVDTENGEIETIYIADSKGLLIYKREQWILHWSDGAYRYLISGDSRDEVVKMAESINN